MLTRGHERVAPGPPGRADGASGTAVTSGVMPLSACDRPVARPVARIARATRTPQSHVTFTPLCLGVSESWVGNQFHCHVRSLPPG